MLTPPTCSAESGTCSRCQAACEKKPGWFLPGEAEAVADHLGLTLADLFATALAVDWWEADEALPHDVFVLSPRIITGEPGTEFPLLPFGTCVFLRDGRCDIHAVKPFECRAWWCGEPLDESAGRHGEVARTWDTPEHQQQIRDLLGREPEAKTGAWF